MDLWRWAPVPSDSPIPAGSSTSVNVLSDRATNLLGHHITLKLVKFKSHLSFHMRVVCNLLDITLVLFAP